MLTVLLSCSCLPFFIGEKQQQDYGRVWNPAFLKDKGFVVVVFVWLWLWLVCGCGVVVVVVSCGYHNMILEVDCLVIIIKMRKFILINQLPSL